MEKQETRELDLEALHLATGNPVWDERRAFMAADWLVRTYVPAWLRAAALDAEAVALEDLPEISDLAGCKAILPALDAAALAVLDARGRRRFNDFPVAPRFGHFIWRAIAITSTAVSAWNKVWGDCLEIASDCSDLVSLQAVQSTETYLQASILDLIEQMLQVGALYA